MLVGDVVKSTRSNNLWKYVLIKNKKSKNNKVLETN